MECVPTSDNELSYLSLKSVSSVRESVVDRILTLLKTGLISEPVAIKRLFVSLYEYDLPFAEILYERFLFFI